MVVKKHLIVKPLQNLETKISETICLELTVAKTKKKKKEKNTEVKMFIVAFIFIVFYCYFLLFKWNNK